LDNLIGELDLFQKEHEAKEKQRLERQHNPHHLIHHQQQQQAKTLHNGHTNHQQHLNEYQIPNNSIIQTQTHHNDSFISISSSSSSTSTTLATTTSITGTFTHAYSNNNVNNNNSDSCSEKNDKISLNASLNYSITSNASMMTNTTFNDSPINKLTNCSDSDKYCWNDNNNDLSADTGFENPSFRHLNDTNIVLIRDDDLPPSYYSQNATDAVVVLRSKSIGSGSNNNSMTDLNLIDTTIEQQKQRLSSFKLDNNNLSFTPNGSPSHYYSSNNNNNIVNNGGSNGIHINNNNSIPSFKGSNSSFGALMYGQIDEPLTKSNVNVNNNVNVVINSNNNKSKPAVTPRPASLLSGILFFTYLFTIIVR
jgi:hypothetical protein